MRNVKELQQIAIRRMEEVIIANTTRHICFYVSNVVETEKDESGQLIYTINILSTLGEFKARVLIAIDYSVNVLTVYHDDIPVFSGISESVKNEPAIREKVKKMFDDYEFIANHAVNKMTNKVFYMVARHNNMSIICFDYDTYSFDSIADKPLSYTDVEFVDEYLYIF